MLEDGESHRPNSLDAYWMPFTANRAWKKDPVFVAEAEGLYYTAPDGKRYLDAIAGLWCVNVGHCHPRIVEAIRRQAGKLDYASTFSLGHDGAFEYSNRLTAIAPNGFGHVFFGSSGSEAIDTALKIAFAYHRARGEGHRHRLIGRQRSYHGVGFGGLSVGGIGPQRGQFGPLLPGVEHLPHTSDLARNAFSRGQPEHGVEFADALEAMVQTCDPSTVAAVIVEPVAASTGVLPPPKGYLERLREICDRHGILLIFDEVVTGFGRLGAPFAAQYFGVTPDLIGIAKGMSNGAVPMGGVLVRDGVHDALMQGPEGAVELFHGYTYSGHPLACAAAMATLEVYRDEKVFENAAAMAPVFEEALHSLRGLPFIRDIRNLGLLGGIEFEAVPGLVGGRSKDVSARCLEDGVFVRPVGDTLVLSPPLILKEEHIGRILDSIRKSVTAMGAAAR
jgi:beta-alanine--pyruvate transaminase